MEEFYWVKSNVMLINWFNVMNFFNVLLILIFNIILLENYEII